MKTVKRLFVSSRPVSWINTAFPFGATYLLITGNTDLTFFVGTLYFLTAYNLMMYGINDVFDFESDIYNPRKTGIEGIVLERKFHKITIYVSALVSAPFLIYLLLKGDTAPNVVLIFSVFMVLAYSFKGLRFKEKPFLDSFTSATHFVSPMLYAMVLCGWEPDFLPYVVSFYLWGIASHAFGAVQDIIPDRKANIASVATFLGARRTVWFAIVCYALSVGVLLTLGTSERLIAFAGLIYILNIYGYRNITDETSMLSNTGWKRFIKLNYITGFYITLVLIITNL